MQEYTLKDIPESDVPRVQRDFLDDNCIIIRTEKQANGMWSITASCQQ